jgi:hypothetical protein
MPIGMHELVGFSSVAAGALVAAIWQGVLLAGCVAVCLRLMPGVPARTRSIVWTAALAMVVLLPLLPGIGRGAETVTGTHAAVRVGVSWALGLVVFWGVLSVIRAAQLARSAGYLWGVARRAVPLAVEGEITGLLVVGGRFGRRAELCRSCEVDVPSVAGFIRPRILLPEGLMEGLSAGEMRQIVMHEMEHLRRRDDWTNLLQKVSLVLFPLNPAVVWIERRLCAERELACDDAVMRSTGARKAYASTLANLAEHALGRRGLSLALGAMERRTELARRVHRILGAPEREMGRWGVGVLMATLLVGLSSGAVALHGAPALVRFGSAPMADEAASVRMEMAPSMSHAMARPTLVRAVMPEPRPVLATASVRRVRKVRPNLVSQRRVEAAPWVVLTGWREAAGSGRLTLTVAGDSQISYAAVPVRNGWLIIQL